jgi:hypothetical protein
MEQLLVADMLRTLVSGDGPDAMRRTMGTLKVADPNDEGNIRLIEVLDILSSEVLFRVPVSDSLPVVIGMAEDFSRTTPPTVATIVLELEPVYDGYQTVQEHAFNSFANQNQICADCEHDPCELSEDFIWAMVTIYYEVLADGGGIFGSDDGINAAIAQFLESFDEIQGLPEV